MIRFQKIPNLSFFSSDPNAVVLSSSWGSGIPVFFFLRGGSHTDWSMLVSDKDQDLMAWILLQCDIDSVTLTEIKLILPHLFVKKFKEGASSKR